MGEPLGEPRERQVAVAQLGPRAAMRAFWPALSASDACTSKTASTREAVTFAC
jgi:hypothetical protein